ncbi:MAG: B12-binding domain-containing protein, partial [Lachnospiraceae bacterium]|nr:B12-binding domain-containing protein [Lachnospiraceae bacterium]
MGVLEEISEQLQKGKKKQVVALCQQALDEGVPAGTILNEGLMPGMNVIG